jgi:hypothetical protein
MDQCYIIVCNAREWPVEVYGKFKMLIQESYLLYLISDKHIPSSRSCGILMSSLSNVNQY